MNKILILLLLGAVLFTACSKDDTKNPIEEKVYTLEELTQDDFEYKEGEKVAVKGLCVHICSHSGKKLFLSGQDPENKLQIFAADNISSFDKKYEGSNLVVKGTLEAERIDMDFINEWENEIKESEATSEDGGHSCEFEDSMKKIDYFKKRVENSKKGFISVYTMTGTEVKEI